MSIIIGCSTQYGVHLGAQQTQYEELGTIYSSGSFPIISKYRNSAKGFHIGFYEEIDYFLTKLSYFSNSYEDKPFSLGGTTFQTSLSDQGLEINIGPKFAWFYPYFLYRSHTSEYQIDDSTTKSKVNSYGGGVELRFDLSDRAKIYGGVNVSYRDSDVDNGVVRTNSDITYTSLYLGLSFEIFKIER
tara:strand:+ start:296 stop:856 length:561 start_codon:yes stop_codon:yes gene_type:complete